MFEIRRYSADQADEWNQFVAQSKNGTFLFDRGYMDYHADRFDDHSLMIFDERKRLYALLPANKVGDTLFSHQGLTYGGLVLGEKATAANVCEVITAINDYIRDNGVRQVIYKALPWIYAEIPSDEPLYALTEVCQAKLVARDIASVVNLDHRLPFTELRQRGVRKANNHGTCLGYSDDFPTFWKLLTDNLHSKYGSRPVHSLDEIKLLNSHFPQNICLFAAFKEQEMVAGTVLFITPRVVKTQYISASPSGKEQGALDLLFSHLLANPPQTQSYFDFGTSALEQSTALRLPLIFQKEGFGGRAVCYDTYEWDV